MNIGFLAGFPNPKDPNTSKAAYRRVTEMIKVLSGDNRITLYIPTNGKWSIDLPFCDVVFIRSSNLITAWMKMIGMLFKDRETIDVLVLYNVSSIYKVPMIFFEMLCSIPTVVDYVDKAPHIDIREEQNKLCGEGKWGLKYWMTHIGDAQNKLCSLLHLILGAVSEKFFLLTMNNWITNSKYLENEIRKFKKNANILFYRGTFSEQLCLDEKTQLFPVTVNEDTINIAYIGLLSPIYGVDTLLNAFSKLEFENIQLYIAGQGPMKPMLENIIAERKISNVSIIHLNPDVVHKFMSKMDILVLPNKNVRTHITNFPSKIIEYVWAGKAIISTTAGGSVLDIFENGKTAILIEPENEKTLRIALADLITDEKKRNELGINARRYFEDNFSEKVVKSQISEYLNDIVNEKRF